jgi:hypothetical protein
MNPLRIVHAPTSTHACPRTLSAGYRELTARDRAADLEQRRRRRERQPREALDHLTLRSGEGARGVG